MQKDLENRAEKFLTKRDAAGQPLLMSHVELSGGRFKPGDTESAAERTKAFLRDRAGINLDAAAADYYRRWKADPTNPDIRMFNDAQLRQIRLAIAAWTNLADFSNRPVAFRTSKAGHIGGLFLGYPAHQMALMLSLGNRLSTRTWLRGRAQSIPMILGMVAAATILGATGQATAERLKRLVMDRESAVPTIATATNPAQMRDALLSGMSAMIPFYGSIVNNVTGLGMRNGFDLNSQIVAANMASDAAKTVKEIWQTGDGTVPSIRMAERYLFPANYLARFAPQYSGLREMANDRNLLMKAARDQGLETMMRTPGLGGTATYTPASPLMNQFANAVGNNDLAGAQAAYEALVAYKRQQGSATPEQDALRAVESRNPVRQVFVQPPTTEQLQGVLNRMGPEDRARVQKTLDTYEAAVQSVGGQARLTRDVAVGGGGTVNPATTASTLPGGRGSAGGGIVTGRMPRARGIGRARRGRIGRVSSGRRRAGLGRRAPSIRRRR
jgi:hypothetical protein